VDSDVESFSGGSMGCIYVEVDRADDRADIELMLNGIKGPNLAPRVRLDMPMTAG